VDSLDTAAVQYNLFQVAASASGHQGDTWEAGLQGKSGSMSRQAEPRAYQAEPRACFSGYFVLQAEPRLGSISSSLDEPSHEPARFSSIPPLPELQLEKKLSYDCRKYQLQFHLQIEKFQLQLTP
jgi:hypothetical protein